MNNVSNNSTAKIVILGVVVVAAIAGIAYLFTRQNKNVPQNGENVNVVPKVTLNAKDGGGFDVLADGKKAGEIFKVSQDLGEPVVLQGQKATYIGFKPKGLSGYLLFDSGYYNLYRLEHKNNKVTAVRGPEGGSAQAFSPDGQTIAWLTYGPNKIILQSFENQANNEAELPAVYNQFGSFSYSPEGGSIILAAAKGFPGKEAGAVLSYDIEKKKISILELTSKPNTFFIIDGWKGSRPSYRASSTSGALEQGP